MRKYSGDFKKSILLPKKIDAVISIDPEMPKVKTDRNGLKQVFINLIKNSAEAMDDGGKISVKTRFLPESSKIMIDEKRRIPGNIEIIFADNGPGIDENLKQTLFDPYTTTKTGPAASGLGLSIVHAIIKELNGTIACQSQKARAPDLSSPCRSVLQERTHKGYREQTIAGKGIHKSGK